MEKISVSGKMKTIAAAALRFATRSYIQNAPWSAGKSGAHSLYSKYVGWRPHRATVRTRFGDLMDLTIPDAVSSTIYMMGHWEPVITSYIRSQLKPGEIFVDCGANIGYYSLVASRLVGPRGKVFAIEASPSIHNRLMRNVTLNRCTNITGINAAASSEKGELSIFLADAGNLGHSTTVESLAAQEGMKLEAKVRADTLESLVGQSNLRNARFIKIDVEGHEIGVLAPLFESLNQFSQDTEWLIELSPGFGSGGQSDVDRIFNGFVSAGYTAYRIENRYGPEFALHPPKNVTLTPLTEPPTVLTDVVMSRRAAALER